MVILDNINMVRKGSVAPEKPVRSARRKQQFSLIKIAKIHACPHCISTESIN